ncbi:hypothetical protein L3X38_017552 [Prunus dulcis]|uniref:Uncharacterized protein n=1 Tax=Prunus dulcis TaxID=3755 RepID=A0AAD4W9X6_PRUDU|nr:hypothetical protein L3X38_017552 [Prunus dulcis]
MVNLHCITTEAQFQKQHAIFASTIPDNMHIRLAKPLVDGVARTDLKDPHERIITFRPFYFSLVFRFPVSGFFKKVFHITGCAPS